MRRKLVAAGLTAVLFGSGAQIAHADRDVGGGGGEDPWVWVGTPGAGFPGGPAGGTGVITCGLFEVPTPSSPEAVQVFAPVEGTAYVLVCENGEGEEVVNRVIIYDPAAFVISAAELAAQAYRELPLVYPDPRTAPPLPADHVVGLSTWLWVPASQWRPLSASASVPGLSATVTATPDVVVWDMGDGSEPVICYGPGTPYAPGETTDCKHAYSYSGTYEVAVEIRWRVRWQATDGTGGTLPVAWRGTRFALDVVEVQAVVVND